MERLKTRKQLKCDETQPGCLVCGNKGIECPGYKKELKWCTKHELLNKTPLSAPVSTFSNSVPLTSTTVPILNAANQRPEHEQQLITREVVLSDDKPKKWDLVPLPFIVERSNNTESQPQTQDTITDKGGDWPCDPLADEILNFDTGMTIPWSSYEITCYDDPVSVCYHGVPGSCETCKAPDVVCPAMFGFQQNASYSPMHSSGGLSDESSQPTAERQGLAITHHDLTPMPIDMPTYLTAYWFEKVCPIWSAFDSSKNPYRNVIGHAVANSDTLSYSIRSMSAACLVESLPPISVVRSQLLKSALHCINRDLVDANIELDSGNMRTLPQALILSLFCVGTSLCWHDAGQLGLTLQHTAAGLLSRLRDLSFWLESTDSNLLSFFEDGLIYWKMLCAVVSGDEIPTPSYQQPIPLPTTAIGLIPPHPWTGVSAVVQDLLSRVLTLCRGHRAFLRQRRDLMRNDLRRLLSSIAAAQTLEEELLALEHPSETAFDSTEDEHTPLCHLVIIAEAYRLASLLQLYLTFPDLVARRLPNGARTEGGAVLHSHWNLPLALKLVEVLQSIPMTSGTRCLQPLLLVLASTALWDDAPSWLPRSTRCAAKTGKADDQSSPVSMTESSIQISETRRFILDRLRILQSILPRKPIIMARKLVKAIWSSFDQEHTSPGAKHWIDVMAITGFQSIFG